MKRYVIINTDTYFTEFLSSITKDGIITDENLTKAMIFNNLDKAKVMMKFIDDEHYELNEIEFKEVCE